MSQLKTRFATAEDAKEVVELLSNTNGNLYDQDILKYPSLRVLCAYNGAGPVVYLPSQCALILESLAVKPGVQPLEAAAAFRDLVKGYQPTASLLGIKEFYFICQDENVIGLAERHGFERVSHPVLRMKL
jgi:hypothetical protein